MIGLNAKTPPTTALPGLRRLDIQIEPGGLETAGFVRTVTEWGILSIPATTKGDGFARSTLPVAVSIEIRRGSFDEIRSVWTSGDFDR